MYFKVNQLYLYICIFLFLDFLPISVTTEHSKLISYHFTPVRMNIIKKSTNNKCWRGCEEKGTLYCWWECKLIQPLWRTVWRFLKEKELRIKVPYDPAIPLFGKYPEKATILKDPCSVQHYLQYPGHGSNQDVH